MTQPIISVVMSAYNSERFISEAIESILDQTFTDFEFIIIDDGSTDNTLEIINNYSNQDDRIRIVINENNIGLAKSLNKGIALAKGKYIARMDADDVSMSNRLQEQLAYLEDHQEITALGSNVIITSHIGEIKTKTNNLLRPVQIKWATFFGNHAVHPTLMVRSCIFLNDDIHYNEDLETTQDYDLWVQITSNYQLANLQDHLVNVRVIPSGISQTFPNIQKKNNLKIRKALINNTVGIRFWDDVIEGTKKPFILSNDGTRFLSILAILLLRIKFIPSSFEKIDKEFVRNDIAYRIGKIIQNSKHKLFFFPFRLYILILRKELLPSLKNKFKSLL